ncbi:hypothetical protein, partial [Candidatus Ichthyocystis sparus]
MNPVYGVGGASSGPGGGNDDADQVDSNGLQQLQTLPVSGLGVATIATTATVYTTTTIPSAVTASAFITTAAASTSSTTTSVGKGISGGGSNKGKGPAPKRSYTTGVVAVPATAVHPATAGANVIEAVDFNSSQTMECCGFRVCTPDLLKLRRMEDNFLRAVQGAAASIFRSRVGEFPFLGGAFVAEDVSNLRDELFSTVESGMSDFAVSYFADVYSMVVSSFHLVGEDIVMFGSEEANQFRELFFDNTIDRIRERLAITWSSEIARALDKALSASSPVPTTTTVSTNIPAPAPVPAPALTRIATTTTTTVATASSISSLPTGPFSPEPGCLGLVDLFGFGVPPDITVVVSNLISEVCALAKRIYISSVRIPMSGALRNLSNSEKCAWCLSNRKLYEIKFLARCFAAHCAKAIPVFIDPLSSIRAWDSSSRSLLPLTGDGLRNFWVSLDRAILRAVMDFFVARWNALTEHCFASLSDLSRRDFVNAYVRVGSPLSASKFASITERMRAQSMPHGDHHVDLFGFEVLPEVSEIVSVLISEVSVLARRNYSSMSRLLVLDTMSKLSSSEQCAWLVTNMMLYKTSFMSRCFAEYRGGLCHDFVHSLFSVGEDDASSDSLLSLEGNRLGDFWVSLSKAIVETIEGIFVEGWSELVGRSFDSLESSSTVLCGGDFVNAYSKIGVPALAASGTGLIMRGRRVKVASRSDEADGSGSVVGSSSASVAVSIVASGSSVSAPSVTTYVEVKESSAIIRRGPFSVPKKSFMSRYSAGGGASFSGMTSSVSSSSSVAAGSLSSVSA